MSHILLPDHTPNRVASSVRSLQVFAGIGNQFFTGKRVAQHDHQQA